MTTLAQLAVAMAMEMGLHEDVPAAAPAGVRALPRSGTTHGRSPER